MNITAGNSNIRTNAQNALRRLLAGESPSEIGIVPEDCGEWQSIVETLCRAFESGGTPKVKEIFSLAAKTDQRLGMLVLADIEPPKTTWTAGELLTTRFPELQWVIPGLLPSGLSWLAGRPKVGKSWLCLQFAIAVGGGEALWGIPVERGGVLYIALEDSPRRLRNRLIKQVADPKIDVVFLTTFPHLSEGGIAELQDRIEKNNYRLCVLDTFSRSIPNVDQNDVSAMTPVLSNLQGITKHHEVALLVVDHMRKGAGSDPIEDVLGSTAKSAVVDAILGLYRERGQHTATLKIVGRDVEEREMALEWQSETCCWTSLGDADGVRKDTLEAGVVEAVRVLTDLGEMPTTTRVAQQMGKDKSLISRVVADLLHRGVLLKGAKQGREQPYLLAKE